MSRRAWMWGAGLFLIGLVFLIAGVHTVATYQPPPGSAQTTTLGQVGSLALGGGLSVAGGTMLGSGCRQRLAIRRRRRLRNRLAGHED